MVTGNTRAKRVSLPLRSKVLRISIIDRLEINEVEFFAVGHEERFLSHDKRYFCRACTDPDDGSGFLAIYERENIYYQLRTLLQPYDSEPNDGFGMAVEFSKDSKYLVVGCDMKSSYIGAAYVFTNVGGGWRQASKLIPPDGHPSDQFGVSVSISDDNRVIVVGAPGSMVGYGSAYVFMTNKTEWILADKLVRAHKPMSTRKPIYELGTSVCIENPANGIKVTGLLGKDLESEQVDVCYTYGQDGWEQGCILLKPCLL